MNDWIKSLLKLLKNEEGICPHCKKKALDYGYIILDKQKFSGCGVVWCNSCKHAFWLSRIKFETESDMKTFNIMDKIPTGLIFGEK